MVSLVHSLCGQWKCVEWIQPKIIVRQVAENRLVFIFPEFDQVYYTLSVNVCLALLSDDIQPDAALLLIKPEASLTEPQITGIQTILTCSPDKKR